MGWAGMRFGRVAKVFGMGGARFAVEFVVEVTA
jgi:hypothetical protein